MLMKISRRLSLPAAETNNQNGQIIQAMILSSLRLSLRANEEDCERMDFKLGHHCSAVGPAGATERSVRGHNVHKLKHADNSWTNFVWMCS